MTHDQKRARLETLLRENDLSLARVSVAIGRNKTYLQQYLRRGMPAVLAFQDTETPTIRLHSAGRFHPPYVCLASEAQFLGKVLWAIRTA